MSPTLSQQRELPCTLNVKSHRGTEPESRDRSLETLPPVHSVTPGKHSTSQGLSLLILKKKRWDKITFASLPVYASKSEKIQVERERLRAKAQKFSSSLGQEAGTAEVGSPTGTGPCPVLTRGAGPGPGTHRLTSKEPSRARWASSSLLVPAF